MNRKVAFVTGASRGIGRAAALELANQGFDIVVTARTRREGESFDGRPLPGSIETTAIEIERRGRNALAIPLDLLDRSSIAAAVEQTLAHWGHIDVLLNNAIYTGPESMVRFLDLDLDEVGVLFDGNLFSQIDLTQRVLLSMLKRHRGLVINMVSASGLMDPPAPAEDGGWGFAYAASKAAFHRMVGVLAVEHPNSGLCFVNVEPGVTLTETMMLNDPEGHFANQYGGAPMEVPAAVIGWLATHPRAREWNGRTLFAQRFCLEEDLHPDWRASADQGLRAQDE